MRVGTKSVLFGAHQFLWHPFTVFLAWTELYGLPSWKECVCILIHDIGYIGKKNMEGDGSDIEGDGLFHPVEGAIIAQDLLDEPPIFDGTTIGSDGQTIVKKCIKKCGRHYGDLVLLHSRTYAKRCGHPPSKLCWADKLSIKYDPWFLYLPRVILSGEILEYRLLATASGYIKETTSNREWYQWARDRMIERAYNRGAEPPRIRSLKK